MKTPQECSSIDQVRDCIDAIDAEIIQLLGKRFHYVKRVVDFKEKTPEAIIAQERKDAVLRERRRMAEENGLSPDKIEEMYRLLIDYFISEELHIIEK